VGRYINLKGVINISAQKQELKQKKSAKEILVDKLKKIVQDLEMFRRWLRVMNWFDIQYEIGDIIEAENLKNLPGLKSEEESFMLVNKSFTVAMPSDAKIDYENIIEKINLVLVEPLHKHIDNLWLAIPYNRERIREILKKYVPENELNNVLDNIKAALVNPVFAINENEDVALIIAPWASE